MIDIADFAVGKCPQGIAIPDMLEQVVADLEDDKTLERLAMGKKMLNM
jgi:hypothetical protein